MSKYASAPILAILAACSAGVENGQVAEANGLDTVTVDNLVVSDTNPAVAGTEAGAVPPAAGSPARAARPAQPKQQADRKPSNEASETAPTAATAPEANAKPEPEAPVATCTAEHRELGHC